VVLEALSMEGGFLVNYKSTPTQKKQKAIHL